MSRRLAQYRAIARARVPVDVTVNVDCPACDSDVVCYVAYGIVESTKCVNGCHRNYSDDERALVEQAAKDAAESERGEIEFREPDDER